jgi:hypothetical protein
MTTITNRLFPIACAALLTVAMLLGIDHLAQTEALDGAQGAIAAAPASRA